MEWMLPLIGGLGIGSLLTRVIDHYLVRKTAKEDRFYQEKRETYLGLLGAIHKAGVYPSEENSKGYALWKARVGLFGSAGVAKQAQGMIDTNDGSQEDRDKCFEQLIAEMRKDLIQ